ncbi:MAG: chorismate lyase [Pseudomonadota bacterium]
MFSYQLFFDSLKAIIPADKEPKWRHAIFYRWRLSTQQKNWLLDSSSLTRRLHEKSQTGMSVEILIQHWAAPFLSESKLLKISPEEHVYVREVILKGNGKPWVFARSVIPVETYHQVVDKLDTRPLGSLLFSDPTLKRSAIEIAKIKSKRHGLPALFSEGNTKLARRSMFTFSGKPIIVSEVFLDDFWKN